MGEVYRARDLRLNRTVAIKILPRDVAGQPGFRARFEREARAIAAVEHPNICPLYDLGADEGVDFLVMQYIEGETLADRIRGGPLRLHAALSIAQQIAAALDAAHMQGVVHRDLKPSNIRLTSDDQVKLVDFGIAKILAPAAPEEETASPSATASPTETGSIMGTAAYMSPEQARGRPVDKRTDIWAIGCVLFEMLTGRRPFAGETVADLLAAVVSREPDWNALPADTPRSIRDLLRHCLQKDPSRRLRDAGDARLAIEDALTQPDDGGTTFPVTRRGSTALAWTIAAAAVLTAAAIILFWRPQAAETRPAMRFSAVTNSRGVEAQPSFSPDGRQVAFVSNRDGQWDIYVGLVTGGSLIRLTSDANVEANPRWSPDGTRLLFARLNDFGLHDIWVVPALGGTARRLLPDGITPAWSSDGNSIAYSSAGGIWLADPTGANPRQVTKPDLPLMDYQPAFSRSGRTIAFVRRRMAGPRGELMLIDLGGGPARILTADDALALSPVWSPDDRFVYFCSSRGGTMNVWRTTAAGGEVVQITAGQGDDVEIDLSSDGRRMVFSSYRANINLAEMSLDARSGPPLKWLTSDAARGESAPRYSPDGQRIAYFTNRSGAERESIWVMGADGANPTRLVEDANTNIYPRWTVDGQELVFATRTPGSQPQFQVRKIALAGGAPQSLPVNPWFPQWGWGDVATDGRLLYRISERAGELYDPRTAGRQSVPDLLGDPHWSPDNRAFAFAVRVFADLKQRRTLDRASDAGLFVQTLDGARRQVFKGWVVWFGWTAAGELLVLEGKPDMKGILVRIHPDSRRTANLLTVGLIRRPFDVVVAARFDAHPDGKRIAIEALEYFEADIGMIENIR